jgi:hypothetical protein
MLLATEPILLRQGMFLGKKGLRAVFQATYRARPGAEGFQAQRKIAVPNSVIIHNAFINYLNKSIF